VITASDFLLDFILALHFPVVGFWKRHGAQWRSSAGVRLAFPAIEIWIMISFLTEYAINGPCLHLKTVEIESYTWLASLGSTLTPWQRKKNPLK
jgi:hypothetical protein